MFPCFCLKHVWLSHCHWSRRQGGVWSSGRLIIQWIIPNFGKFIQFSWAWILSSLASVVLVSLFFTAACFPCLWLYVSTDGSWGNMVLRGLFIDGEVKLIKQSLCLFYIAHNPWAISWFSFKAYSIIQLPRLSWVQVCMSTRKSWTHCSRRSLRGVGLDQSPSSLDSSTQRVLLPPPPPPPPPPNPPCSNLSKPNKHNIECLNYRLKMTSDAKHDTEQRYSRDYDKSAHLPLLAFPLSLKNADFPRLLPKLL